MTGIPLDRRFIAFVVAGGVNTMFGYGLFGILVTMGMGAHPALILAGILGVLFNFLTTALVFGNFDLGRLPRFLAAYSAMLALNILLLDAVMRLGVGPLVGQALILPVFTLSFFVMRRFVFAASSEQTS